MAPTCSLRAMSQERSGTMTSTPMGSFGNMTPQSTTAIRPSASTAMQFMPISPSPPRATMRTGGATAPSSIARAGRAHIRYGKAAPLSDPVLDSLNDAQREAVLHGEGPLLVLAGAGSGKTRVIVHRVAHLVLRERVMPWHVLCVTFTNKAAGEMRERLQALLGDQAQELWVSTFHAFGARFLRREAAAAGLPSSFPIYDMDDQLRLVKQLMAELRLTEGEPTTARDVLSAIDRWKNDALR